MRENTIMNHITGIIAGFDFSVPLHHYLKNYFRQNKQLGSRDRKIISSGCFAYYRCAQLFAQGAEEEKLAWSLFLTGEHHLLSEFLFQKYALQTDDISFEQRLSTLQKSTEILPPEEAYPFLNQLSPEIDREKYFESLFRQPYVWIRIRAGFEKKVKDEIAAAGITPVAENNGSPGFLSGAALTTLPSYTEGLFEIQDISSQLTVSLLPQQLKGNCWDCCSGSGGKTLMIADKFPDIHFLLSDNRTTILDNARLRLNKVELGNFKIKQLDLNSRFQLDTKFDLIVADVPCSGSGTWGRTPESLWNHNFESVAEFAKLQESIIHQITPFLKQDGLLLYITCSAFSEENEENIQKIVSGCNLSVVHQKLFHGYQHHADTMYGCLLKKN